MPHGKMMSTLEEKVKYLKQWRASDIELLLTIDASRVRNERGWIIEDASQKDAETEQEIWKDIVNDMKSQHLISKSTSCSDVNVLRLAKLVEKSFK